MNIDCTSPEDSKQNVPILLDERLEILQPGEYRILQKLQGFHYTMDSVLLADFARIRPRDRVLDFGTGTCILPLLCLSRDKGSHFDAFEIQSEIAEMAGRTVRMNGLENQIAVHSIGVEQAHEVIPACSCDAVIANPPYGIFGTTLVNPDDSQRTARHQTESGLDAWMAQAFRLLRGKGRLSMVYPASQMLEVMEKMRRHHLEPKRFRLVYPSAEKAPNIVLIEAIRDGHPMLSPEPPLIVHNADGSETEMLRKIYRMEEEG